MSHPKTAVELARAIASRQISVPEVAEEFLSKQARAAELGVFLNVDADAVRAEATAIQAKLDSGWTSPLAGVPVAVKDNIAVEGQPLTCASKILEGYIPPYSASVTNQLRDAGCLIAGKTNLDEFAMGSSTETSAYQLSRNPWDLTRSPGGSSGGSAAAVAGGITPLSLGSDTGGSIRQPAALTGIVGFKPTYGRVSRYGLVAFASSLDQIGPFGTTVEDVAHLTAAISGHCGHDSTSLPDAKIDISDLKGGSLKGKRFAVPREMMEEGLEDGVRQVVEAAFETLRREGVEIVPVSVPSVKQAVTIYYIIAPAEASSNLGRFDGVRYGPRIEGDGHAGSSASTRGQLFGREVKLRIMTGTYVLSAGYYDAYYRRAQQVRTVMADEFAALHRDFDAVISPTSPTVAFTIGSLSEDPMALKVLDSCTIPANMGGFPAISLNAGLADGLPVGLQLMGPVMGDERILQLAYTVEQVMPKVQLPFG
ncbi:MAG: Asp-tRNA(Asn)/Glu-tRNA(Gln) amidotransferase subunit GatA [Chthonomonas sp.]|nr:Asp-tRNA(Asn)/Glu-tRNA(Gln) amidotransferase subunit GatA [Chthonomonas sp.]